MAEVRSSGGTANAAPIPFIDLVAQHKTIEREVMEVVERVFATQSFILGEEVAMLEAETATYCDAHEAIGCASGTDALILALMALGIGPGDEVITSPFTFFATASSIVRVGATPVFADIDPVSFNLDPAAVDAAVTPRTKAIMPVHLFGQVAEMVPLLRTAARYGLAVIEDACQAIGAEYHGRRAGVLGTIGCFSFFPTKNLGGAGDGGIITTDDPDLAKRMRRLRVHGDSGGYTHVEVGLNSRLDALQAAVLRVKLRHLDDWTAARQQNAARYQQQFQRQGLSGYLTAPEILPERRHVFNQYVTRIAGGQRNAVLAALKADQIGAAVYYPIPLHLQQCFSNLGYVTGDLPESERACREVLALPIYSELPAGDQERVIAGLRSALGVDRATTRMKRAA
ncbi:MAG: DegT/DnrJ/EryC1/StrS family aminotransferase [Planctomycetota bacterium]|nr:DegT/DnrJ/EryC1/StrS family aminotransferase [Planctomycetaceae bacterium]MDQ3333144.1 DegT/DnrJ/EryC1/StrS family aminotransferase [Planctomycetota bacterium]